MTTIIISILAALGIGGGVMLASSGGGGGHSSGAIVGPSNPGGGGGSGGGTSASTLIISNPNTLTTFGMISEGNTTIENNTLTMGLSAFAPIPVSESTYAINEVTRNWYHPAQGINPAYNAAYLINYGNTPNVFASFDLRNISTNETNEYADFYEGQTQTMFVETLNGQYIYNGSLRSNVVISNSTWSFTPTLALGGRKLGLTSSDFGYVKYISSFTDGSFSWTGGNPINKIDDFFIREDAQQFYFFDTSKQIMANQYAQKYGSSEVTFTGRTIGGYHYTNNACGIDRAFNLLGDISLTLNFANNQFTGSITNLKPHYASINVRMYDFTLIGNINAVNSTSPNLTFTSVTPYGSSITNGWQFYNNELEVKPLMSDGSNNFGYGVLVQGDNTDEAVGEIAFVGNFHESPLSHVYYHLAFGAKKQ